MFYLKGPTYKSSVIEIKKRETSKVVAEDDEDNDEDHEEDSEPLLAHEKA